MTRAPRGPGKYFAIFTVSGFAGLIYESIWTHYLKLLLGHAAYAQTLVLAMFMGGMAAGAWLCGRRSGRWRNLLLGYAAVEAVIGIAALAFHPLFVAASNWLLYSALPALAGSAAAGPLKWSLAALLIVPQSVLLGMTFPLMTAGLLRRFPQARGASIATLYFTNSLGGAVGVLASGFVLIDAIGLPGTVALAGALNIALALAVAGLARRDPAESPAAGAAPPAAGAAPPLMLLAVAALTGLSSFAYEIGWIRMLSLVLGASTHAFELMLSAFIFGLALGGLWIRGRMDRIGSPLAFLAGVQVVMGLAALATLPLYGYTFDLMAKLVAAAPRDGTGYALFNLASHGLAALVMLPAAICAGMTLPLITHALLRAGAGEGAIGRVYAANTLGAIAGVVLSVHFGLPLLGLKGLVAAGAAVDIALAVLLLRGIVGAPLRRRIAIAAVGGATGIGAAVAAPPFDPLRLSSGVFRNRQQVLDPQQARAVFYQDGKTATVSVLRKPAVMEIRTNGKADASVGLASRPALDEVTATMLAALPLLLHPHPRSVANIGIGSGLSAHVLLAHPGLERVDTVEIEPAMVAGARHFLPLVSRAFDDARSHIHIEDAKTFFAGAGRRYDVIVSEPSNPWVSGVASLFSLEFYRLVRHHLAPDGLFVQWLQLYETDEYLVMTVLKALQANFADYAMFAANHGDLVIVASPGKPLPPLPAALAGGGLAAELQRVGIGSMRDVDLRRLATRRSLGALVDAHPAPANSDYRPVLDQKSARARFMGASAQHLVKIAFEPLPLAEMLGGAAAADADGSVSAAEHFPGPHPAAFARHMLRRLDGDPAPAAPLPQDWPGLERDMMRYCSDPPGADPIFGLLEFGIRVVPFLGPRELEGFWAALDGLACGRAWTPAHARWIALLRAVGRRDAAAMAQGAEDLLAAGEGKTAARLKYLAANATLGRLAAGEHAAACETWARHGVRAFGADSTSLLARLLAANAGAAGQGAGATASGPAP